MHMGPRFQGGRAGVGAEPGEGPLRLALEAGQIPVSAEPRSGPALPRRTFDPRRHSALAVVNMEKAEKLSLIKDPRKETV